MKKVNFNQIVDIDENKIYLCDMLKHVDAKYHELLKIIYHVDTYCKEDDLGKRWIVVGYIPYSDLSKFGKECRKIAKNDNILYNTHLSLNDISEEGNIEVWAMPIPYKN